MKKSIVLLISLFFISALSVLILKNLEDTNSFIKEKNHKINKIQILTSVKNLQVEISRLFTENKEDIDTIVDDLDSSYIPLNINNISISFSIKEYEKVNINLLTNTNSKMYEEINTLFSDYEIGNFDTFRYIYKTLEKEYKSINSSSESFIKDTKQINDIINLVIKETYTDEILKIKDKLGFLKRDEKLYELFVKVNYLEDFIKAYYILNEKGEVKYFESSFK